MGGTALFQDLRPHSTGGPGQSAPLLVLVLPAPNTAIRKQAAQGALRQQPAISAPPIRAGEVLERCEPRWPLGDIGLRCTCARPIWVLSAFCRINQAVGSGYHSDHRPLSFIALGAKRKFVDTIYPGVPKLRRNCVGLKSRMFPAFPIPPTTHPPCSHVRAPQVMPETGQS